MVGQFYVFLEDIYGVLFTPGATLPLLTDRHRVLEGAAVIVLVNILEAIRSGATLFLPQVLLGMLGWVGIAAIARQLCQVFQKQVALDRVLTLTGFASIPWLFMAPALCFGGAVGSVFAYGVIAWFLVWQVWALSIALDLSIQQTCALLPLAFIGGTLSTIVLINTFKVLISIG